MNLLYLSSVELRQICYFLAVTEAGNNFTKAAEYLHIDPPPLGQRIKSLEKKLQIGLHFVCRLKHSSAPTVQRLRSAGYGCPNTGLFFLLFLILFFYF